MQAVKRIEIVTDALEMPELTEVLTKKGISGYTLIRDVVGQGGRGYQSGDDLADAFKNSLLLIACNPDQVSVIVEVVRPIIKKRGGMCLVSDAQWVIH
jgi:nitrogen regulatory protein PII